MATEIRIAAVGDILMSTSLISASRLAASEEEAYNFDPLFRHVVSLLQSADLTIGNLEIPLAGRECKYTRKDPKTGFFTFNCPDELAASLKASGFDVLTTANNHCLDRGFTGLCRTLDMLDQHQIEHTGTYRTSEEASQYCVRNINGIKVGVLGYSKSTNKFPIPADKLWCVNIIDEQQMIHDLQEIRKLADLVIVCPHFGQEYKHIPGAKQRRIVRLLWRHGADIILGSHPHVIQPFVVSNHRKLAVYSLGNFISTTLNRNEYTRNGVIAHIKVKKDDDGRITISSVEFTPTWVRRVVRSGQGANTKRSKYEIWPIRVASVSNTVLKLPAKDLLRLKAAARHTWHILHTKL